jgi:octaprenyl-diphosphate synthase
MPVIFALAQATADDRDLMVKIIRDTNFKTADFNTLVGLLEKHGGIAHTKKAAADYIAKSKRALSIFEPSQPKEIMLDIADYAISRTV